jgi:hypothetical protein
MEDAPEVALSAEQEDIRDIAFEAAEAISGHEPVTRRLGGLLENYHHEITEQIRDLRYELSELTAARTAPGGVNSKLLAAAVFVLMLIPLLWLYNTHLDTRNELVTADKKIDELVNSQQLQASRDAESADLRVQLDNHETSARLQSQRLFDSIAWAVNLSSPYGIYEEAFSDQRLAIVQELLTRLTAMGFKGTVQLESHLGDFCLTGDEINGYIATDDDMYVSECSLVGHPLYQLPTLGERQSIGFANFLATSPLINGSDIQLELVNYRNSRPKLAYPPRQPGVTVSEWNNIAAANNRVEVTLIPEP